MTGGSHAATPSPSPGVKATPPHPASARSIQTTFHSGRSSYTDELLALYVKCKLFDDRKKYIHTKHRSNSSDIREFVWAYPQCPCLLSTGVTHVLPGGALFLLHGRLGGHPELLRLDHLLGGRSLQRRRPGRHKLHRVARRLRTDALAPCGDVLCRLGRHLEQQTSHVTVRHTHGASQSVTSRPDAHPLRAAAHALLPQHGGGGGGKGQVSLDLPAAVAGPVACFADRTNRLCPMAAAAENSAPVRRRRRQPPPQGQVPLSAYGDGGGPRRTGCRQRRQTRRTRCRRRRRTTEDWV